MKKQLETERCLLGDAWTEIHEDRLGVETYASEFDVKSQTATSNRLLLKVWSTGKKAFKLSYFEFDAFGRKKRVYRIVPVMPGDVADVEITRDVLEFIADSSRLTLNRMSTTEAQIRIFVFCEGP